MKIFKIILMSQTVWLLTALFFIVGTYSAIIQPELLLDKVRVDLNTTIGNLGNPSAYYFTLDDCSRLQFISRQEMNHQNIKVIYVWSKGLDLNIVAGFDELNQLKFKTVVHNELL